MDNAVEGQDYVMFHGYKITREGVIYSELTQTPLRTEKRFRRGGGFDETVRLHYARKRHKWTVSRLVAQCFIGPTHGYEINHKDRDPTNNHVDNLERVTPSENQCHWRRCEK